MSNDTIISSREATYAVAIAEAIAIEMERDPSVFLVGEEVGEFGGVFTTSRGLIERFGPERVRDTPIAEAGFSGVAIGAAIAGMRPIVEIMFSDFLFVAADQLLNQAAKLRFMSGGTLKMPLTVRTTIGVTGGGPQHSQSLEAVFAHLPGFAVALPSTPADAKGLLASAIRMDEPTIVFEHRGLLFTKGDVPKNEHLVPFGHAAIRRVGRDVTLVAYSRAVSYALAAAETLALSGIEAEVIDLRTIVPLDLETVTASAVRTGYVVVVHESHRNVGVGAEIAASVSEAAWGSLRAPVQRVCGLDIPVPFAQTLEGAWIPGPERIVQTVLNSLGDRGLISST